MSLDYFLIEPVRRNGPRETRKMNNAEAEIRFMIDRLNTEIDNTVVDLLAADEAFGDFIDDSTDTLTTIQDASKVI